MVTNAARSIISFTNATIPKHADTPSAATAKITEAAFLRLASSLFAMSTKSVRFSTPALSPAILF
jgi:hypothetical protein